MDRVVKSKITEVSVELSEMEQTGQGKVRLNKWRENKEGEGEWFERESEELEKGLEQWLNTQEHWLLPQGTSV